MRLYFKYIINRLIQKFIFNDYEFSVPLGQNLKVTVSNPPGNVLRFAKQKELYRDLEVICETIKKGETFFDVGANYGHYTLTVYSKLDKDIEIHCFEPEEDTFRRLLQNKRINHANWKCNKFALGENDEWTFITNTLGGLNYIVTGNESGSLTYVTTLDQYCNKCNVEKIDLMKIDVEGFEYFVLKGASKLLQEKKIKKIIFEVDDHEKRYNISKNQCSDILTQFGYKLLKEEDNFQLWGC